jgi:hypothetical protein
MRSLPLYAPPRKAPRRPRRTGRARLQPGHKQQRRRRLPLCRRPEWSPKGATTELLSAKPPITPMEGDTFTPKPPEWNTLQPNFARQPGTPCPLTGILSTTYEAKSILVGRGGTPPRERQAPRHPRRACHNLRSALPLNSMNLRPTTGRFSFCYWYPPAARRRCALL